MWVNRKHHTGLLTRSQLFLAPHDTVMAADLLSELRSIQALLGTPASDGKLGAAAPARLTVAAAQSSEDESEPEAAVTLPSSLRQAPPTNATRELEREVGALRHQVRELGGTTEREG